MANGCSRALKTDDMKVYENYSLLHHNTFGIDARCRRFIEYETADELHEALAVLREHPDEPFLHIGAGSNLLFTRDFPGTILHSAIRGVDMAGGNADTVLLRVGAGEVWDDFVARCVSRHLYGIENLSLIPGEVGAAAVQNIGAYGEEVEKFIDCVETIEVASGKARVFTHDECRYGYRSSFFKGEGHGRYVVTHVVFRLSCRFAPVLSYGALQKEMERRGMHNPTAEELRRLVVDIRRAKLPDPSERGNAGSFFVNPVVSEEKYRELAARYPDMPHYAMPGGVKIPAGWLIEQCGWKGRPLGRTGVHDRQALVLVNLGGATGSDVVALSDAIRSDVRDRFGIDLHPEVNFI